ncbi:hypothetical protein RvY_09761 [Ramazzottius varieornatus]|uniref:Uncharacterized protein n=1 Tax=Ramazzottius varieornatus TaxID=947166 RepID=A0A1D1VEX6_RAMVA|nr:hypothetical protein RvY_09761 [Ramazzottius varieornatus]
MRIDCVKADPMVQEAGRCFRMAEHKIKSSFIGRVNQDQYDVMDMRRFERENGTIKARHRIAMQSMFHLTSDPIRPANGTALVKKPDYGR